MQAFRGVRIVRIPIIQPDAAVRPGQKPGLTIQGPPPANLQAAKPAEDATAISRA